MQSLENAGKNVFWATGLWADVKSVAFVRLASCYRSTRIAGGLIKRFLILFDLNLINIV